MIRRSYPKNTVKKSIKILIFMKELMLDTDIQIDKISNRNRKKKELLKYSSIESETPSRRYNLKNNFGISKTFLFKRENSNSKQKFGSLPNLLLNVNNPTFNVCFKGDRRTWGDARHLFWFVFKDLRHLESIVIFSGPLVLQGDKDENYNDDN
ncbi:hypothetical protein BpHYR1_053645 [Brachionus plicatilis]|uniref:Uncharacterized protein n=1 Tax=Brachionus plicatilis TaxID=10195 RepID=A0A3M7RSW2_BRAPC|nr:hypothetical protein BpHYR1_053645 [Brachionus plicatilis]